MHSLLHAELARANDDRTARDHHGRSAARARRPGAPPGRLRPALAHVLAAAAGRVDRDVARRAIA